MHVANPIEWSSGLGGRSPDRWTLLAVPAMRKDGSRISIEFSIALLRGDDGGIIGPAAVIRDVTARWNEQNELRKRLAALEAEKDAGG